MIPEGVTQSEYVCNSNWFSIFYNPLQPPRTTTYPNARRLSGPSGRRAASPAGKGSQCGRGSSRTRGRRLPGAATARWYRRRCARHQGERSVMVSVKMILSSWKAKILITWRTLSVSVLLLIWLLSSLWDIWLGGWIEPGDNSSSAAAVLNT